jgi:hypothetical protein
MGHLIKDKVDGGWKAYCGKVFVEKQPGNLGKLKDITCKNCLKWYNFHKSVSSKYYRQHKFAGDR